MVRKKKWYKSFILILQKRFEESSYVLFCIGECVRGREEVKVEKDMCSFIKCWEKVLIKKKKGIFSIFSCVVKNLFIYIMYIKYDWRSNIYIFLNTFISVDRWKSLKASDRYKFSSFLNRLYTWDWVKFVWLSSNDKDKKDLTFDMVFKISSFSNSFKSVFVYWIRIFFPKKIFFLSHKIKHILYKFNRHFDMKLFFNLFVFCFTFE